MEFEFFPTTRYQGSKRKLLPWLYEHFKKIKFVSVLDAFGGSGSVSYLLKKMKKEVTFNDKLKFNYNIGKAIIENNHIILNTSDLFSILKHNNILSKNIITEIFDNIYYLRNENQWLDNTISNIISLNHYPQKTLSYKKSLAYYALYQACLIKRPFNLFHRNNLYIRIADVIRGFGNKSTWDKSFDFYFIKFVQEVNNLVFDSGKKCTALNKSILEIKDLGYDLIYLDPPYISKFNNNDTSNYLKNYHFLEGISNYEKWIEFIDHNTINKRFKKEYIENEFLNNSIYEFYENIFYTFRKRKFVLSYKNYGKPSISFFCKTLKKLGKNVSTHSVEYKYALSKNSSNKYFKSREYLIFGL